MKVTFPKDRPKQPGAIRVPYQYGNHDYATQLECCDIQKIEMLDDAHTLVRRCDDRGDGGPLCLCCPLPVDVVLKAWVTARKYPAVVVDISPGSKPFVVGDVQEATVGEAVNKKPHFSEQQCDELRRILTLIDKLKIARDAITTGDVVVNAMDVKNATSLDTVSCHFSPPFKGQLRASLIDCLNAELNRLRESLPFEIQTKDDSNLDADET